MKRLFLELFDRVAPLASLTGLLFSIGMLGSSHTPEDFQRSFLALTFSCIAMWAFWSKP